MQTAGFLTASVIHAHCAAHMDLRSCITLLLSYSYAPAATRQRSYRLRRCREANPSAE